jgi:hypothetical protein
MTSSRLSSLEAVGRIIAVYRRAALKFLGLTLLIALLSPIIGIGLYFLVSGN